MTTDRQHEPISTTEEPSRALRWSALALASGVAAAVLAWLASLVGAPDALTHPVGRLGTSLALPAALATAVGWFLDACRRPPAQRRLRLALLGILMAALVVRLIGVDHEVGERSYLDEGTYYRYATDINEGELLPHSFVYPHLLYYVDAFTLWAAERTPGDRTVARVWSGTDEPLAHQWLWLRLVAATLSAFTVLPVFGIGFLLAGGEREVEVGIAASTFYVLSPLFNEGSHLFISDFPSACLATFSLYFVARLAVGESLRAYLLAGVFAGLAAATKYPAGTVAAAIPTVWLLHRLRSRAWRPVAFRDLTAATLAAIAAFVGVMPSFFRAPIDAVTSPRGMLFGLRQYSEGGWLGVQPDSHAGYYLGLLAETFGLPALLLIAAAPVLARREQRRRILWLAPYPLGYLALMVSMSMAVKRNLAPAIPVLAALAGVGLVLAMEKLTQLPLRRPAVRALSAALCVVALVLPARSTALDAIRHARSSTREEAARRLDPLLPIGATIVKESYTPRLDPSRLLIWNTRFYPRIPRERLVDGSADYLLLSSSAFARFLRDDLRQEEHHDANARRYREVLDGWEEVLEVTPDRTQRGPALFLFRVPVETPPATSLDLSPGAAWVNARDMRRNEASPIRFTGPGQWAVFRGHLATGLYRARLLEREAGVVPSDEQPVFRAVTSRGEPVADLDGVHELVLARDERVLFQIRRAPGMEIDGLVVEPLQPEQPNQ